MQYRKWNTNRFSLLFFSILYILFVFFIFSLFITVLNTPKNFQQKIANYTYYFPCFYVN